MKKLIAIIGPPSCGKTTVINELAKDYSIVPEQARKNIPNYKFPEERLDFQKKIFFDQVDLEDNADGIIFCDTGRFCDLVYLDYYGLPVPDEFKPPLKDFKYDKVFLLSPLPFEADGIRKEKDVEKLWIMLYQQYKQHGKNLILLDKMSTLSIVDRIKEEVLCK